MFYYEAGGKILQFLLASTSQELRFAGNSYIEVIMHSEIKQKVFQDFREQLFPSK